MDSDFGTLVGTRMVLQDALKLMSSAQRMELRDRLSTLVEDLRRDLPSPSDLQEDIINVLERTLFHLSEMEKFPPGGPQPKRGYFLCIKCDIPLFDPWGDCPGCGSSKWIELAKV